MGHNDNDSVNVINSTRQFNRLLVTYSNLITDQIIFNSSRTDKNDKRYSIVFVKSKYWYKQMRL